MGQVLLPPTYLPIEGPLLFLAGPIQGAPDWQTEAIRILQELAPEIAIASPRKEYPPGMFNYEAQVDWETHYLRRAARLGVILFWLTKEATHQCDRAYAQTTRFELAEWKVRAERDGVRLAVGIEEGFTNARYIRRRFSQDCPAIPIFASLDEVCRYALTLVTQPGTTKEE